MKDDKIEQSFRHSIEHSNKMARRCIEYIHRIQELEAQLAEYQAAEIKRQQEATEVVLWTN